MITSFPNAPRSNQPGLSSFRFAPVELISAYPPIISKRINAPLTFLQGGLLNGYAVQGTLKFNEDHKPDPNNGYYDWLLTGQMPGDSPAHVELMEAMELHSQFIAIARDHLGLMRFIGYQGPLSFSAAFDSSLKGYNFTFSGSSASRAPYYTL